MRAGWLSISDGPHADFDNPRDDENLRRNGVPIPGYRDAPRHGRGESLGRDETR